MDNVYAYIMGLAKTTRTAQKYIFGVVCQLPNQIRFVNIYKPIADNL